MSSFQQQLVSESLRRSSDAKTSRVVEFVVPQISLTELAFIFPLLGHLSYSEDPRWVTCIGSLLLSKKDCRQFGLNRYRLLQVLPSQRCNVVDIAERALLAGKSHTVFCQAETVSTQDLVRLEQAASRGMARCVIVRNR
ncbi:MAG: hypothetical protein QM709_13150 [Spongiibacteraceae bacterium]